MKTIPAPPRAFASGKFLSQFPKLLKSPFEAERERLMSIRYSFKGLIVLCAVFLGGASNFDVQGQVFYTVEGTVGRLQYSSPSSGVTFSDNGFFHIEVTVKNFAPTCCQYGLGRNYEIASAQLTAPAFGLLNAPVLNDNLEVFLFDNGLHEQFALELVLSSTPTSRISDIILFDSQGFNFLDGPFVPSPFNRDLNNVPLSVGGSWRNAFELADGSTLGLWFGTFNGNIHAVPEPSGIFLALGGMMFLFVSRWWIRNLNAKRQNRK